MSGNVTDKTYPSIDGYRILRVIGHGGMSTVYLAEQASLERKVALKVMLGHSSTYTSFRVAEMAIGTARESYERCHPLAKVAGTPIQP